MPAFLPLFRTIVFTLATLFAIVVLGISAHIEYLVSGYQSVYLSFAAIGLAAGAVTALSLPLFLVLARRKTKVFTSMIVFEIVWGFLLWLLWVATAGDSAAAKAYYFPEGCIYRSQITNQICYEFTVVEGFSFVIFFAVFIYYDTLVLYSIINAIRGKGVWTSTVAEASAAPPIQGVLVPMTQYAAVPGAQGQPQYGYNAYNPNMPPMNQGQYGSYNGPPQQPQGPYNGPPQQLQDQYNSGSGAPMQANPQYNYNSYSQASVPGSPAPGTPQQQPYQGYSPSPSTNAHLPPQPNYNNYPQQQLPLPSGYQQ